MVFHLSPIWSWIRCVLSCLPVGSVFLPCVLFSPLGPNVLPCRNVHFCFPAAFCVLDNFFLFSLIWCCAYVFCVSFSIWCLCQAWFYTMIACSMICCSHLVCARCCSCRSRICIYWVYSWCLRRIDLSCFWGREQLLSTWAAAHQMCAFNLS